ncbi:vegetative cell wall protein gp1-like [Leopardus geoffroyi]|uniref:vegetative cell wall protein gp1-like n=1 Tax=Leopardus geoffroyi TaxID=46844 RepID=UPI001E25E24D|nr:vegetative cell wall protein gp1-like [Leopardus geoffroyi]
MTEMPVSGPEAWYSPSGLLQTPACSSPKPMASWRQKRTGPAPSQAPPLHRPPPPGPAPQPDYDTPLLTGPGPALSPAPPSDWPGSQQGPDPSPVLNPLYQAPPLLPDPFPLTGPAYRQRSPFRCALSTRPLPPVWF